jgi:hypothetical protein
MDLFGGDGNMVQQRLARHLGIIPLIVGRDAPFVSPKNMRVLPGNEITERFLS